MTFLANAGQAGPPLVAGFALLGIILSPLTELVIAKLLPRLGGLPSRRARITTAATTGTLCAAFAFRFGVDPALPALILLAVLGVQLAGIDISFHLLPNPLVILLLLGGVTFLSGAAIVENQWTALLRALASAAILFAVYAILALISPRGIGMGDVKLAGPIGLYLGYLGWTQLLYGSLVGFIFGGIATALLLRWRRDGKPSEVAYGPSMLAAAIGVSLITGS